MNNKPFLIVATKGDKLAERTIREFVENGTGKLRRPRFFTPKPDSGEDEVFEGEIRYGPKQSLSVSVEVVVTPRLSRYSGANYWVFSVPVHPRGHFTPLLDKAIRHCSLPKSAGANFSFQQCLALFRNPPRGEQSFPSLVNKGNVSK